MEITGQPGLIRMRPDTTSSTQPAQTATTSLRGGSGLSDLRITHLEPKDGRLADQHRVVDVWCAEPGFICVEHRNEAVAKAGLAVYGSAASHGLAAETGQWQKDLLAVLAHDPYNLQGTREKQAVQKEELRRRAKRLVSHVEACSARDLVNLLASRASAGETSHYYNPGKMFRARVPLTHVFGDYCLDKRGGLVPADLLR